MTDPVVSSYPGTDDMPTSLGITYKQFAVLLAMATENLPTNTTVTVDDIDAILTWVLPEYREMLS